MAINYQKEEILEKLKKQREKGSIIVVYGAGSGFSAKCGEEGGADVISVYSTAILRMQGLPPFMANMGYCDVNALVLNNLDNILPAIKKTPCIVGIGAHDPRLQMDNLLDQLKKKGVSGIVNEPFAEEMGRKHAAEMEKLGYGFSKEVEMIRLASKKGMLTLGWCTNAEQAREMAKAGADIVGTMILHGKDGESKNIPMDEALDMVKEICNAAKEENPDIFVITHGTPFMEFDCVKMSIENSNADGYACGSSGERIPAQKAIISTVNKFKNLRVN